MSKKNKKNTFSRRSLIKGALGAVAASPFVWIPKKTYSQTAVRGQVKHLIYIRLSGGFRFTSAFNGDVSSIYNPFGKASNVPAATQWGVGKLLGNTSWLNQERIDLGMKSFTDLTQHVAVVPCVDHEPGSANADGNHGSALDRFLTGQVGGDNGFLTMVNYGLKDKLQDGPNAVLPAISFDEASIGKASSQFAAYRPPIFRGDGFERFASSSANPLPNWAQGFDESHDRRYSESLHPNLQFKSNAYSQTRIAAKKFATIFSDPLLKTQNGSNDVVDGLSNRQLETMFGSDRFQQRLALSLRLLHFGSPAIYMNQGNYDLHSDEESRLGGQLESLVHGLSALEAALKVLIHPDGGSYWDHTMIVLGSEFGRTARGQQFNSAKGSDHNNDLATRWLSMPIMGGIVDQSGIGGRSFGSVRPSDLQAEGKVYSYRTILKTMLDSLGADHSPFFLADSPTTDLFG